MKKIVLTLCSVFLLASLANVNNANAYSSSSSGPFYIEPYAGYFLGSVKGDNFPNGDLNSLYYGARIGIETARGLIFGIDYGQGTGSFDRDVVGASLDGDYEQKDLGAFIGYRLNSRFRVYGSYIFMYNSEFENAAGGDTDIEGDGFNFTVSFKAHSSLKIGFEYQIRNLKEYGNGDNVVGSNNRSEAYLLTLKLPVPMPFDIR